MDKSGPGDRIVASQTEHMTARIAASDSGILGVWWSEVHSVTRWDGQRSEAHPDGWVEMLPTGYLQLVMGDLAGWRPYVSIKGIDPQAPMQCSMRYRFDGTEVWDDVPLNYADGRHVGVGGISDGTLGSNSRWSGIRLACLPGFPGTSWGFDEITFGYVQLGDG